ncbi:MAG: hypothetical protein DRQ44_02940, partial [Gammaproteobacteria bacterium]
MDGLKIAPCIFRTSHIHVGRIPQGARKAVWLCLLISLFPAHLIASTENDNQADFQPFETRDQNL